MVELLTGLKVFLEQRFNAGKPEAEKIWIQISSDLEIPYMRTQFPAIFIWEDGEGWDSSVIGGQRQVDLNVKFRIIGRSVARERVNFDESIGLLALRDRLREALTSNKKLEGLDPLEPLDYLADGLRPKQTFEPIGLQTVIDSQWAFASDYRVTYFKLWAEDWPGPSNE